LSKQILAKLLKELSEQFLRKLKLAFREFQALKAQFKDLKIKPSRCYKSSEIEFINFLVGKLLSKLKQRD